jgi:hypothetical protein
MRSRELTIRRAHLTRNFLSAVAFAVMHANATVDGRSACSPRPAQIVQLDHEIGANRRTKSPVTFSRAARRWEHNRCGMRRLASAWSPPVMRG